MKDGTAKIIAIIIGAVLLILLDCGACNNKNTYDPENWGAYYDWGPDHYWNTQSHSVESKWG